MRRICRIIGLYGWPKAAAYGRRARMAGADFVFIMPSKPSKLRAAVSDCLGRSWGNSGDTQHLPRSHFGSTLQASGELPTGSHALQEMHSALSAPLPDLHRSGRSGWRIKRLDRETKSAAPDRSTSSILLKDRRPPTNMTLWWLSEPTCFLPQLDRSDQE